jgi:hypothetical protein
MQCGACLLVGQASLCNLDSQPPPLWGSTPGLEWGVMQLSVTQPGGLPCRLLLCQCAESEVRLWNLCVTRMNAAKRSC